VQDHAGLNTADTVRDTAEVLRASGARRVLAVSHAYHLPRVKLAFERAGVEAYTVPAPGTRWLVKLPWLITREVAALWSYYLVPRT
jgi:uncharacterized SAM-binding protein YcdF (DUF218 family)